MYQDIADIRYQIDVIRPAFSNAQMQPPSDKAGVNRLRDLMKLNTGDPKGFKYKYDFEYVKTLIDNARIELNDLKERLTALQASLADEHVEANSDSVATVDQPSSVATGAAAASGVGDIGGMLVLQLLIHNHLVLLL